MIRLLLALTLAAGWACAAQAEGGGNLPPVNDQATVKECGACHIPYPPQMLPMRSWHAIMSDLANHFGDNAALPDKTRSSIEAYLAGHAADAPGNAAGRRFLYGIQPGAAPLRITETAFWQGAHGEIPVGVFADPRVKLRSNCAACHAGARQGQFGEVE
jgi:hypothetical protein